MQDDDVFQRLLIAMVTCACFAWVSAEVRIRSVVGMMKGRFRRFREERGENWGGVFVQLVEVVGLFT